MKRSGLYGFPCLIALAGLEKLERAIFCSWSRLSLSFSAHNALFARFISIPRLSAYPKQLYHLQKRNS